MISLWRRNDPNYHAEAEIKSVPVTRMKPIALFILLWLPAVAFGQSSSGVEKKTSVSLIYEAIAATNATLWLAEDARLF